MVTATARGKIKTRCTPLSQTLAEPEAALWGQIVWEGLWTCFFARARPRSMKAQLSPGPGGALPALPAPGSTGSLQALPDRQRRLELTHGPS